MFHIWYKIAFLDGVMNVFHNTLSPPPPKKKNKIKNKTQNQYKQLEGHKQQINNNITTAEERTAAQAIGGEGGA